MSNLNQLFLLLFCLSILLGSCNSGGEIRKTTLIDTVHGSIPTQDMGLTLSHEHIMSNFGRPMGEPAAYDRDALLTQVVPYLRKIKSKGVQTIFDCTTAYFGRRVDLLQEISDSTGINIVTNTGYYGAANDRYVPKECYQMSADQIAEIWIGEWEHGISNTEVRPGFIKLAFDHGSPSDIDLKLFEAGCITHQATGLTLAVHTGDNAAAVRAQLSMLTERSIGFDNWIWVHANKHAEDAILVEVAQQGAWVSLDGVKSSNLDEYVDRLAHFKEQEVLNRVLLSHDGNGFPGGKSIRPFEAIVTSLVPALINRGFSRREIKQLLEENPASAFVL